MLHSMRSEGLKGHVDLLLLATLAEAPGHGYGVVDALRERSEGVFDLSEGTVYPALYRLERAGLVASEWSSEGSRRRRIYRLSDAGQDELEHKRAEWKVFSNAVMAVAL
jgi:PadR family transcriptional regulator PadR